MWTYEQRTGRLRIGAKVRAVGYSGHGSGKNNPDMQSAPRAGPIPAGRYAIGKPYDTTAHGPHVLRLTPLDGTDTFGRSGFLIHGDSRARPGTASIGCIILDRATREAIARSGDAEIEVVA